MGGDIAVSSVAGSGSRFTLTLPRAQIGQVGQIGRKPPENETFHDCQRATRPSMIFARRRMLVALETFR